MITLQLPSRSQLSQGVTLASTVTPPSGLARNAAERMHIIPKSFCTFVLCELAASGHRGVFATSRRCHMPETVNHM